MTDSVSTAWARAYAAIVDRDLNSTGVECPAFGEHDLRLTLVDAGGGMGFGWIWSPRCRRGIRLSRLKIPGGTTAIALSDGLPAKLSAELDSVDWDG